MYNKIILMGNLTRDVEIRYSQGGSAIGNTGIATNRKWKSQTGEQKEEVMFVDLTFFGRTAEIANQYLRKGSKVLVDGRLSLDQWTAQDGTKRSKHVVIVENLQMLPKSESAEGGNYGNQGQSNQQYGNQGQSSQQYGNQNQSNQQYDNQSAPAPQQQRTEQPPATPEIPTIDISEDEIPF
ncbi:MAG: single-stranded DNA-binding protein [Campylobacterota bacterium]|nr:single-stranded DNA-binding protein [Campylobacterota bacterium]